MPKEFHKKIRIVREERPTLRRGFDIQLDSGEWQLVVDLKTSADISAWKIKNTSVAGRDLRYSDIEDDGHFEVVEPSEAVTYSTQPIAIWVQRATAARTVGHVEIYWWE